jgi:hypothetical protein
MRRALEAAIASGELVPASAVAAERERCAKVAEDYDGDGLRGSGYEDQLGDARQTQREIAAAIRALEPASGEYVLVPKEPTEAMLWAGGTALHDQQEDSAGIYRAMLTAATSNGSGK